MKQPVLLLYNLKGERLSRVRMAAAFVKARVREVRGEEFALPLGALCGLDSEKADGAPGDPAPGFDDEMLVMAFFPPGTVDLFLQTLRRMGAGGIALKAVLTPTNAAWDGARLCRELSLEREAIRAGERAHREEKRSQTPESEKN